jgi:1-acyl-sn-glycerol-3-phosphate acyltransferase
MTTATASATSAQAAPTLTPLLQRSDHLYRWFSWWVQGYLQKHFHAVRLSRCSRPSVPAHLPLVVVMNHPSWWDPLIGAVLARLFPERTHFAPMDAHALARYNLFDKLGFYGVEQGTPRGGIAFLKTTLSILSQPDSAVWIAAQGAFTDPRVRPPGLLPGIGHVAARLRRGVILPVALEYPFWDQRFPEALARFGEPILIESSPHRSPAHWVEHIEASLEAAQDALLADALSRNPRVFETLLVGNVAIGGIYDRWRRFWAWLRNERFQAEHGSQGGDGDVDDVGVGRTGYLRYSGMAVPCQSAHVSAATGTSLGRIATARIGSYPSAE